MEFESDEALLEQAKKDLISKSKTRFESLQEDGFLVQAAKRPGNAYIDLVLFVNERF